MTGRAVSDSRCAKVHRAIFGVSQATASRRPCADTSFPNSVIPPDEIVDREGSWWMAQVRLNLGLVARHDLSGDEHPAPNTRARLACQPGLGSRRHNLQGLSLLCSPTCMPRLIDPHPNHQPVTQLPRVVPRGTR